MLTVYNMHIKCKIRIYFSLQDHISTKKKKNHGLLLTLKKHDTISVISIMSSSKDLTYYSEMIVENTGGAAIDTRIQYVMYALKSTVHLRSKYEV